MAIYRTKVADDRTNELNNVLAHFPSYGIEATSIVLIVDRYEIATDVELDPELIEHLNLEKI